MQAADCCVLWSCDLLVDCVRVICGVVVGGGVKQAFCHKYSRCPVEYSDVHVQSHGYWFVQLLFWCLTLYFSGPVQRAS